MNKTILGIIAVLAAGLAIWAAVSHFGGPDTDDRTELRYDPARRPEAEGRQG